MQKLFVAGAIATSLCLHGCGGGDATTTAAGAATTAAPAATTKAAEAMEDDTPAEDTPAEDTPAEDTPAENDVATTVAPAAATTVAPATAAPTPGSRCAMPVVTPTNVHSIASVTTVPKEMPEGMPAPGPTTMEMWMKRTGDIVDCNMKMRMKTSTSMEIPGVGEMATEMKMISIMEGDSGVGYMVMDMGMPGVPVTCQKNDEVDPNCDAGPPQPEGENCETEKNIACPAGAEGNCDMWKFQVNGTDTTFYFKAGTNDMAAMIGDAPEGVSTTIYSMYDDETEIPDSQFEPPADWGCAATAITV